MQILRQSDPYDFNIADVDTSRPLLPSAVYPMEIVSATREAFNIKDPPKDDPYKKGERLALKLKTVKEHVSTTGDSIPAGRVTVFHSISLTTTPKYNDQAIRQNLTVLFRAVGIVDGKASVILSQPAVLVGKRIEMVKLSIAEETEKYPARNEVQYILEPPKK
jgi:hypothetical protein